MGTGELRQAFPDWKGPAVGLLDLDAFFASVEQLDHPDWRGKPVIVGGDARRRGVVSTASYEARRYGVRSAMSAALAERLCPDAIWTHGHFDRYRELSSQVMACILDETPFVEQVSIDEAFFDVTPGKYARESPIDICRRIQGRVAELGVTCSIGLATSKAVAKIASEREKPRGLTVVLPGLEATFLAPLPVRALSGIGAATAEHLERLGIRTLGELARQDRERMLREFGVAGPRMVERAAGRGDHEVRSFDDRDAPKSVSHERTFAHDLTDERDILAAISQASEQVGARLRRKGLTGSLVTLKLKFDVTHTKTAQARLDMPSDDEHVFGPVAQRLLPQIWRPPTGVRLVGVGIGGIGDEGAVQLRLFGDGEGEQGPASSDGAARELSVAADRVRERFGSKALSYGRDLRLGDS